MTPAKPANDLIATAVWRVVWLSLPVTAGLIVVYGGGLNWLRLALFALLTLAAQRWAARSGPSSSTEALWAHTIGSILIEFWMVADPDGFLNRVGWHDLGFVALSGLALFGLSVQAGLRGALVSGSLAGVGLIVLNAFFGGRYLLFGSALLLTMAWLGVVVGAMYRRLEAANARLERLVLLDPLTELENRRALERSFVRHRELARRRDQPLLLSSWDLNDLKTVNDMHGHVVGDAHLRGFAEALRNASRSEDLCFRTGGDEFVGLHVGLHDGAGLMRRVQKRYPQVACGWTIATVDDLEAVLEQADRAMYANKATMKSRRGVRVDGSSTGVVETRDTQVLEEHRRPN
jgi:diguanylate cyclase (GGDEF)-like protein